MNKEQLIALGLTEEQADNVINGFGQMVPKARLDDKINEAKDLKDQIEQRDNDLKELKKQAEGSEELQTKLADLQKQYDDEKSNYEAKLKDTQLTSALKLAVAGKVHDSDLVTGLIEKSKIELDENGNITKGLDEQLKTLQESKSFLFVPDGMKIDGITPAGGDPNGGRGNPEPTSFGKKLAEEASKSTAGLEDARKSYFGQGGN